MTKEERGTKWDAEFIPCNNHPKIRCKRADYRFDGHRRCNRCVARRQDGAYRPANAKYRKSDKAKQAYTKAMKKFLTTDKGKAWRRRNNQSEAHLKAEAWRQERRLHG